ncbi:OPA3 domain protein, partial [Colletotrichum tofieldiae]
CDPQNQIKAQAHEHPKFRAFAARYGQSIHQLNMRLNVALLRNPNAEQRAKEKAEAPTVKTKEQVEKEEAAKARQAKLEAENSGAAKQNPLVPPASSGTSSSTSPTSSTSASGSGSSSTASGSSSTSSSAKEKPRSVWRRKFRPLPESKAVDLFADVIGDAFILGVASAIIVYEYWKASQKPDQNAERIRILDEKLEELTRRERELAQREEERSQRYLAMEAALRELRDPKTKKPLLPSLQLPTQTQSPTPTAA